MIESLVAKLYVENIINDEYQWHCILNAGLTKTRFFKLFLGDFSHDKNNSKIQFSKKKNKVQVSG